MFYDDYTQFLAIPGPVEMHPKVYEAMNRHLYGHRTDHFREIYVDCVEKFKPTINTKQEVYFLAGSGSLGLHAAITNLVKPGDTVVNLVNGKFGERVEQITARFTENHHTVRVEYGQAIKPEMVKKALEENPDTSLVTITHNETSTGILNPLPEISKVVHDHGALLMADCITSAGGDLVEMDKWKIDFFVSGSQKCYGVPPGLAFIAFSEAAAEKMKEVPRSQDYYSDLLMYREKLAKAPDTPFTPAVSLIYGLQASLDLIHEEGMENRIKRHRLMGKAYRNGLEAMGIKLFAEEGYRSNTVTSAVIPEKAADFIKIARQFGVLVAGGQGTLKGKIWRVGHMNTVGPREILMITSVVELALKQAGADIELGKGVQATLETLNKAY